MADSMLLADLVATADVVAATSKRSEKVAALAALLGRTPPADVRTVVGFLTGEPRQGSIGVGWATVGGLDAEPADAPSVTVAELDVLLSEVQATTGEGSVRARTDRLTTFLERCTEIEGDFVRRLLIGELRQGALGGLMADAVAKASATKAILVRRAAMLSGDLSVTAEIALVEGTGGLEAVGLHVGRPVQPMLASTAEDVADALDSTGEASVEWKLDGIRVQVHRHGSTVRVYTRNLNDITARTPEVVEIARSFPADRLVLDGEVIGWFDDEAPHAFQDTMSRVGREDAAQHAMSLDPHFFDILHLDGRDLIDEPLSARADALAAVTGERRIRSVVTDDPAVAEAFMVDALAAGHEGVVVKAVGSLYLAGRRGKAWRKVKPVHTLDLVVIGVEWGSGRRRGWLSNLHLGALDDQGRPVMVGKTFKGLTDRLLTWQTEQLLARETARDGHIVRVRPELVVEIALDGAQASTRYPGGVALRFARVRRYREDKAPADADTLDAVRALLPRSRA
jgi:DNA ligase-1